jgi:hypothetical protein
MRLGMFAILLWFPAWAAALGVLWGIGWVIEQVAKKIRRIEK